MPELIASDRPKPIQLSSVISYLSEAVAYTYPQGVSALLHAAALWDAVRDAPAAAVWRIHGALVRADGTVVGLRGAKDELGEGVSYGQIKAVAAALVLGVLPDAAAAAATASPALAAARAGGSDRNAPAAAEAPAAEATAAAAKAPAAAAAQPSLLPPHLARVLSAPSQQALAVHQRWLAGVPLSQAGVMGDGVTLGVSE